MNRYRQTARSSVIALAVMAVFCASLLPAQTPPAVSPPAAPAASPAPLPTDPTASTIPPAQFKIETIYDKSRYEISSPLLLAASLACSLAGTILCLYSGTQKSAYDKAYSAWSSNQSSANLSARDSASSAFYTPLLIGAGLDVLAIVLAIGGYDQGGGIKNLTQVKPQETVNPPPAASPAPEASPAAGPSPSPSPAAPAPAQP